LVRLKIAVLIIAQALYLGFNTTLAEFPMKSIVLAIFLGSALLLQGCAVYPSYGYGYGGGYSAYRTTPYYGGYGSRPYGGYSPPSVNIYGPAWRGNLGGRGGGWGGGHGWSGGGGHGGWGGGGHGGWGGGGGRGGWGGHGGGGRH
jgi:hypothetical protein